MIPIVTEHIPLMQSLFAQYKMRKVWIFGSAVNEDSFGPDSDVDFLYEPNKELMSIREFLDFPLLLRRDLEALFGREVDLIRQLPFRNPYFKAQVEQSKVLIFDHAQRAENLPI